MAEIRKTVTNMAPSTRYTIRARAINEFGVVSDWSDAVDFTTLDDDTTPLPPTGLEIEFDSPNVIASWEPVSTNVDGSPMLDFSYYEISFTFAAITKTYQTTSPVFIYTYRQNQLDFGTARPNLAVTVSAVDVAGHRGGTITGSAINEPPADPTVAPDLTTGFTMIAVTMEPAAGIEDLAGFDLYHATSGAGPYVLLVSTTTDSYTHQVAQGSTHYYSYKVRDVFGQVSAGGSPAAAATSLAAVTDDGVAPNVVANLHVVGAGLGADQRAWVELEWDFNSASDLASYELRWRRAADSLFSSIMKGPDTTDHRFESLDTDTTYYFQIRAADVTGNISAWAPADPGLSVDTVLDTVPPGVPTGLAASSGIEAIFVRWDANTEVDFSHYELYGYGASGFVPDAAKLVFSGNATVFTHNVGPNATRHYRIRALDVSGNASDYAAEATGTSFSTFIRDELAPGVPTGLSLATGSEIVEQVERTFVTATWSANTEQDLAGYQLQYRRASAGDWTTVNIPRGTVTHRLNGLLAATSYDVRIAAYDTNINVSAFSAASTIITGADSDPPGVPPNPGATVQLRTVTWRWDGVAAADFAYYEAQVSDSNGFGTVLHTETGDSISFTWLGPFAGVTYYMRVRAVDVSGNESAWSSIASAQTTAVTGIDLDTEPPAVPTGLALATAQEFNGQVENVYINATWTAGAAGDLAGYSVRMRVGSETRYVYMDVPANIDASPNTPSAKFTGVAPNTLYGVQVQAYDSFGNYSGWATEVTVVAAKDATAPPTPTSVAATVSFRTINWKWNGVVAVDFDHYEAQVDDVNDFASPLHTQTDSAISFAWVAPAAGPTYYMRVKAVDVSGNSSDWSATQSATTANVAGVDIDTDPPTAPVGLALTTGQEFNGQVENVYVNATWTANTEPDLAAYNVRIRKGAETRYTYAEIPEGSTSAKFTNLQPNTSYGVQVLAYDAFGNYSAYSTEVTLATFKDATVPVAPTGLAISAGFKTLILQWTANTEVDFDHYEIHVGASAAFTATATNLYSKPAQGTTESISKYHDGSGWVDLVQGSVYYIKMYAVDVSANKSTVSAEVSASPGVVNTYDVHGNLAIPHEQTFETFDSQHWNLRAGSFSNLSVQTGGLHGGKVLRAAGYAWIAWKYNIPFDPSKTYKISGRVRQTVDHAQKGIYIGVEGIAADGTTLVNISGANLTSSQHYIAADGDTLIADSQFTNFVGYFRGTAGTGSAQSANPNSPGVLHTNVRYFRPLCILNYSSGAGTAEIDNLSIEEVGLEIGTVNIRDAAIVNAKIFDLTADKITASNITAALTVTGGALQTGTSGGRMVMNSSGLIGYATNGTTKNFEYKNSDGSITIVGGITSGGTITGTTITGGTFQTNATPTTDGIIIEDTNGFRAFAAGVLSAQVTRLGVFTFKKGSIIGTAADVSFTIGSASTVFKVDSSGLYLGSGTYASAPFRVDYSGNVVASLIELAGGTITGAFNVGTSSSGRLRLGATADTGARIALTKDWIRAFGAGSTNDTTARTFDIDRVTGTVTIDGTQVSGGGVTGAVITGGTLRTNATPTTDGVIIEDTNGLRAFAAGVLNAQITRLGVFTFKKGSIVGTAADVSFTIGSASTIFKVDGSGLYLGAASFASAPFRVDYSGNVVASLIELAGGTITGAFNIGTSSAGRLRLGAVTDVGGRITLTKDWIRAFGSGSTDDTTAKTFEVDRVTGAVFIDGTVGGGGLTVIGGTVTGSLIKGATIQIGDDNLFTDNQASAETDTTGWGANQGTLSRVGGAGVVHGAFAMRATCNATATLFGPYVVGAAAMVTPGQAYTAIGYVTQGAGSFTVTSRIEWRNAGGLVSTTVGSAVVLSGSPQLVQTTAVAPALADRVIVTFYSSVPGAVGNYFDCDAVGFFPGTVASWSMPNSLLKADPFGLYIGHDTFGSAPFSVDMAGKMIATKLSLDTRGMAATDVILNSSSLIITAGGTVAARNLQASTGRIGDVQITSTASSTLAVQATSGITTLDLVDASSFAASGSLNLGTQLGAVAYTGKSINQLTGVTGVTATHPIGTLAVQSGKLVAGTIEGATINVASAGSINFTGSGNLTWQPGATGGVIVSDSGFVRSGNFTTGIGGAGWQLGPLGLEINDGTIRARALQIGVSSENLLRNSSFENDQNDGANQAGLADHWVHVGDGHTYARETGAGNFRYQLASQKVTAVAVSECGIAQTLSVVASTLHEEIPANSWVTISYWIKSSAARNARARLTDNTTGNGAPTYTISAPVVTGAGAWKRVVHSAFVTGPNPLDDVTFRAWVDTPGVGEVFYFEGAQLELSSYVSSYHPTTLEIPDNYIQSAYISTLTADKITTGTIAAQTITVGSTGFIQSLDYVGGTSGYRLTSSKLTFENGGIEILGQAGILTLDASGLRAVYSGTTQFQVDNTGVYIGGSNAATADLYVDTAANVTVIAGTLKTTSATHTFEINTAAQSLGAKLLRLYLTSGGEDSFYLTNDGLGFFAKGVIGYLGTGASGNVIKNSSFERDTNILTSGADDLDYWNRYNVNDTLPVITQVAESGVDGSHVARITWTTNTGRKGISQNVWTGGQNSSTWPANSTWMLSLYTKQAGTMGLPGINFDNANAGFTVTTITAPTPVVGAWQRYVYKIAVDATPRPSTLYLSWAHTNGDVKLDGVQLERGELATAYLPAPGEVLPLMGSDDIRSSNYVVGTSGWAIKANGSAEFSDIVIRGTLAASAITGNLTMSGSGKIKTASSGQRIEITSAVGNKISFYSGNANELDPGSVYINDGGSYSEVIIAASDWGDGGSELILESENSGNCYSIWRTTGGLSDAQVSLDGSAGEVELSGAGGVMCFSHYKGLGNTTSGVGFPGKGAVLNCDSGNNKFHQNWDGTMRFYIDSTNVKNFIIPHPVEPDERYLIHTTLEGPENAVFYRGEGRLENGKTEILLPDYFEALCADEGRSVQLTCIADDAEDEWCPVLHATRPRNGRFHVGLGSGMTTLDQAFWWEVKAIRKDVAPLLVEPLKTEVEVLGDGPYTYYRPVKPPVRKRVRKKPIA